MELPALVVILREVFHHCLLISLVVFRLHLSILSHTPAIASDTTCLEAKDVLELVLVLDAAHLETALGACKEELSTVLLGGLLFLHSVHMLFNILLHRHRRVHGIGRKACLEAIACLPKRLNALNHVLLPLLLCGVVVELHPRALGIVVHLLALIAVLDNLLKGGLLVNALGEPLNVLGSTRGHHSCFC
ncbi:hypothetical protein FR483_n826L [Paramecium bursaria Chlorella virus FR483]|uniref:Uncharacterized protein n826L n=1 Tax=Paramecium bursaria Chlorella virus FR483 TaxID=399781 RepID=A7J8I0_PBCVF|nr:hypothetical protein FR483_n826L [Paramecium bursaria Chlorella virus FR483]ABT16111.1 hypothetical protein FR483_n826L [Paramecium bursaria Chlorella virus FR483]